MAIQLSIVLKDRGLDCYKMHVDELVRSIDDSKRFAYIFYAAIHWTQKLSDDEWPR